MVHRLLEEEMMITRKFSAEKTVRDIRRATRKHYSSEEKFRIVLEGLSGEESVAELCRRECINANICYRWSKLFTERARRVASSLRELLQSQSLPRVDRQPNTG